jgi:hypothetical protein
MSEPSSRERFDPKAVNALDWVIVATGVLAFIFSLLPYYTYTLEHGQLHLSVHGNAWHGFFGRAAVLLAVVGCALVAIEAFVPATRLRVPTYLWAFGFYVAALVFVIIAGFVWPGTKISLPGLSYGRGIGYWLSLIVILAGTVVTFLRLQQTGPTPGPLGKIPKLLK